MDDYETARNWISGLFGDDRFKSLVDSGASGVATGVVKTIFEKITTRVLSSDDAGNAAATVALLADSLSDEGAGSLAGELRAGEFAKWLEATR